MMLKSKVAIVTGATRGIGLQIALGLARQGARVVIAARTVEPRRTFPGTLAETVAAIEEAGGTTLAVQCDISIPADVDRLVTRTVEAFGRIDIVVNNAADMVGGDFEALIESMLGKDPVNSAAEAPAAKGPLDDWLQQFAINVHGPYLLTTLAAPYLRAQGGGVVINITSEAAELVPLKEALDHPSSNPSLGYHVTKAALNRLTNSMAAKLAPDNIAVIAVDPGVIRTEVVELLSAGGLGEMPGAAPAVPAAAVIDLLTTADPMDYSGQVLRAQT